MKHVTDLMVFLSWLTIVDPTDRLYMPSLLKSTQNMLFTA